MFGAFVIGYIESVKKPRDSIEIFGLPRVLGAAYGPLPRLAAKNIIHPHYHQKLHFSCPANTLWKSYVNTYYFDPLKILFINLFLIIINLFEK